MKNTLKSTLFKKSFVSPFLTIGFLAISITGALLFFHVKNGAIMTIHEWFGWAFIVGGIIHLLINLKPLLSYFKSIQAIVSCGVAAVLLVALTVVGMNHKGGRHGHGEHGNPEYTMNADRHR